MKNKTLIGSIIISAILIAIAVCVTFLTKNTSLVSQFVNQNEAVMGSDVSIKTSDGNFKWTINKKSYSFTSTDLIKKASELLGKKYDIKGTRTKGVNGNPWMYIMSEDKVMSAKDIENIDCSGLLYWTISSLAKSNNITFNPANRTSIYGDSNISAGFSVNNPAPLDTNHWLTYGGSGSNVYYWKEVTGDVSAKSAKDANLKIFGNNVNILKAQEKITSNYRYYQYKDASGKVQTLPAGTIIIANSQDKNKDHSWICLGDLGTNDVNKVKTILINMGIPSEFLNRKLSNGQPVVQQTGGSCTFWRIESAGGIGVYINNGNPNDNEVAGTKTIGPIWAFQIANSPKGDYDISVNKVDEDGNAVSLKSNIFSLKRNNTVINGTVKDNTVTYPAFSIAPKDLATNDTIIISETTAPADNYVKYDKEIKLIVKKRYSEYLKKLSSEVVEIYIGGVKQSATSGKFDGGKVTIFNTNGSISVIVKNTQIVSGEYNLRVVKVDDGGNGISGAKFNVQKLVNNATSTVSMTAENGLTGSIKTSSPVSISETSTNDVYIIEESSSPDGYSKFPRKIKLEISKKLASSKYMINTVVVYVENSSNGWDKLTRATSGDFQYLNGQLKVDWDSSSGIVAVKVKNQKIDLALKKMITTVNGVNVTKTQGFNVSRHTKDINGENDGWSIDASNLTNGTSTNAVYNMNKTPVEVQKGDIINYSIKIFNEGEVNARANKIRDYIPDGLNVLSVSYKDSKGTEQKIENPVVTNGILTIDLSNTGLINAYSGTTENVKNPEFATIDVTCKVTDSAEGVLTNIAEITEYYTENDGVIAKDIDSTADNWNPPTGNGHDNISKADKSSDAWRDYSNDKNDDVKSGKWSPDYVAQDAGLNNNKGDDDDFDKVIVLNADIALKKMITKVNDVDVTYKNEFNTSRHDENLADNKEGWRIDATDLAKGESTNALYQMNKTPVRVHKGDVVTYQIKIFNEGAVNAKANKVVDYIPTGLTVTEVSYVAKGQNKTISNPSTPNGVLTIDLSDADLIKAYSGTASNAVQPESYIINVKCKVGDNAVGILTNVAEITEYATDRGIITKDIDSTSGDWVAPKDSNGNVVNKNNGAKDYTNWRNYSNGKDSDVASNVWSTGYVAQDSGLNGNKGDDDDFDKVEVIDDYEFELQKVSGVNGEELEGFSFYIAEQDYSYYNEHKNEIYTTNSEGKTPVIKKDITYQANEDEEDLLYIVEKTAKPGYTGISTYVQFELRIKKTRDTATGQAKISKYAFSRFTNNKNENIVYKDLSVPTTLTTVDKNNNTVYVNMEYDFENNRFIMTVPNHISDSNYKLNLVKVTKKQNESDEEKVIPGVKFAINTTQEPFTTDINGKINFGTYPINLNNFNTIDEYRIKEVQDKDSRYHQVKDEIDIKVKKGRTSDNKGYEITGISLNNSEFTKEPIESEVDLVDIDEKVKIEASLTGNTVTIKVPNIEKDGQYSLVVAKVNKEGVALLNPQTGFSLGTVADELLTSTVDGKITLVSSKEITADNYKTDDTYTIQETTAPQGYIKLKDPIEIVVKKKDTGSKYEVDSVIASTPSAGKITVKSGEIKRLTNVLLEDNVTKVDVIINLQTQSEILISVPNTNLTGKYNLEIYKYSEKNGQIVNVPGIGFNVRKLNVPAFSTLKPYNVVTNDDGIAEVKDFIISNPGTDQFIISEVMNSDKYIGLAESLTIETTFDKNDANTKYVLKDAKFDDGTTTKQVQLKNGKYVNAVLNVIENDDGVNTVKLSVENPEIKGKYFVDLVKIINKENGTEYAEDVTFKVREETQTESQEYVTDENGKVNVIENEITYENYLKLDQYVIDEISFENNDKYVRLKEPLKLHIMKDFNRTGETGTENAVGTKFVVSKFWLLGEGLSSTKYAESEAYAGGLKATLKDVALEDGSVADIEATFTQELDQSNNESVGRITVKIPNRERNGDYSVRVKKVDENNISINGATFNVESNVNGIDGGTVTTERTDASGIVNIKNVTLDAETLDTVDTYKISEIKIYKNSTSTEEETGYAKLPEDEVITLSVKKGILGNKFVVSEMSLAKKDGQPVTSTDGKVTLENVTLENGELVNIEASIDEENVITVTIPNKEIFGNYSMNLLKTKSNFTEVATPFTFKYTGNELVGSVTDENGEISIVDSYNITKENVNTVDVYEIKEVEDKNNIYLELADKLTVNVEKTKENNAYVVSKITITSGAQSKSIIRGSEENTVRLDNVATVNSNRTTSVKLSFDETTQKITVHVDNPVLEGEYALKLKKIDSRDETKVLQGVEFKSTKRELINTFEGYTPTKEVTSTTQEDGVAYVAGDNPYTSEVELNEKITRFTPDIWRISEQSTLNTYKLIEGVEIVVNASKKISNDGTKYVIDPNKVKVEVHRTEETEKAVKLQEKLLNSIQKIINEDGTEITIVIPNDLIIDYNFKMIKKDNHGNDLTGAKFTVVDSEGTIILNNEVLTNGSYFVKEYKDVEPNTTYKFTITENESPARYINILNGFDLQVSAKLDEKGNVDIANSLIEIMPKTANYDRQAYSRIQQLINNNSIGLSLEDDNTIAITLINPEITTDYSLKLFKTEVGESGPLAGAEFNVTKDGENLTTFTTNKSGPILIDSLDNLKVEQEFNYEVEETRAPGNYEIGIAKARIKVNIDIEGNVSAQITEIHAANGIEWIAYNEAVHGQRVKLVRTEGTNEFTLQWTNSSNYVFYLYKEGFNKELIGVDYDNSLISADGRTNTLPLLPNVQLSVKVDDEEEQLITTGSHSEYFVKNNVKANSEYKYVIKELSSANEYNNEFDGIKLILHVRTDENAKLIRVNQNSPRYYSYYEIIDETGTKTNQQIEDLKSKMMFVVSPENNVVTLFMVNTKEPISNTYKLQLWKYDEKNLNGLAGAEFEIKLNKGTTTETLDSDSTQEGIQNFTANEFGLIDINNIEFTQGTTESQIHTFTITEIKAPEGYKKIEGSITATVDLTNKMTQRDINSEDLVVTGPSGVTIKSSVDQNGYILIGVPNTSNIYILTLRKFDTNGNLIKSSVVNGLKEGTKFLFRADTTGNVNILEDTYTFDDAEISYTENVSGYDVSTFEYTIKETESKIGYTNMLKDYELKVYVKLDSNGKVMDVDRNDPTSDSGTYYRLTRVSNETNVSPEKAKEYVKLYVVDDENDSDIRHVMIDIENPNEYKVRLRKTNTLNTAIDKAVVVASLDETTAVIEKARIEGTSQSETDFVTINEGETQTWVIDELNVQKPYSNIFEGDKALYVEAKMENQQLTYNYYVKDGDNVITDRNNDIYKYIVISKLNENGNTVLDVQIKNPVGVNFELYKTDIFNNQINEAKIRVNDVTNENGNSYDSSIRLSETNIDIFEEKTFIISEEATNAPYVNLLGNNKLIVKGWINDNNNVEITGKGYIDENGVEHNDGFGPFSSYVRAVAVNVNSITGMPTISVRLINPIQYKFKLNKVDGNGNKLANADFEVKSPDGTLIKNEGSDNVFGTVIATPNNYYSYLVVRENESANGYNNDIANKELGFRVAINRDGTIQVGMDYVRDVITNRLGHISDFADVFSYRVIQASETEDGIPVVEMTLKNTTDYSLNIVKKTTDGMNYDGAELELYKVDAETNEETLIANNIVNETKLASILLEDIEALPNKTYKYAIYEKSTTAPYVNILNNKKILLSVNLTKDETTGELSFNYNYNICDNNGNVIENDSSAEFIRFDPVKDETTGKYTLNVYIQNPVEFKMNFVKTDLNGNALTGKTVISIDDGNGFVDNNGTVSNTYTNLKVGQTVTFTIMEKSVQAPFVNILGNNQIILGVGVQQNGELKIMHKGFIDNSQTTPRVYNYIPENVNRYFNANFVTGDDGIQTLDIKLRNPISYKIKLNKQNMNGVNLNGANISVKVDDKEYKTNGNSYLEIPINDQKIGDVTVLNVKEESSANNYENVFEGKTMVLVYRVFEDYTVGVLSARMVDNYRWEDLPSKYFNMNIDNMVNNPSEITVNIVMKNPIKYNFEVVKTDLSGNEIEGNELQLKVTKNTEEPIGNNGKSTIEISEEDLVPNTVNKYVIEELSTIAPHVNELKDKKLTVEVKVDENGNLVVQKFEVTDSEGNVVANEYVTCDDDLRSEDGTRLIRISVKNPISYKFKLTKLTTPKTINVGEVRALPLNGASLQVNDVTNENGSPEINMEVNDVKIGDRKTFVIKELSSPAPHSNLLKDKEIRLGVIMGSDKKLRFTSQMLVDTITGQETIITENVKEQYKLDYKFVTGDDGIETLEVEIQNPIEYKLRIVKKDASETDELIGAEIEMSKNGTVVASNKSNGSSIIEYEEKAVDIGDTINYIIKENSTVSPNQNILRGKAIVPHIHVLENEKITANVEFVNTKTGEFSRENEFVNSYVTTDEDGIQVLVIEITNPVGFDIDLVKNAAGVGFLNNTKFEVYRKDAENAVFDGYVTDINTWKSAEVQENNMIAGRYTYYITETKTARERYINVLEDKYIKINVEVSGKGVVKVMDNNWNESPNYYEVYEGMAYDVKDTDVLVDRNDLIYQNINVNTFVDSDTNKYVVQCNVTNPVKYNVSVEKQDSAGKGLAGAQFELVSAVIDEQNATKTDIDLTEGVNNISEDGKISASTNEYGIIRYQENYVNVGTYEYALKEIKTSDEQYVNPLEGCTVYFKVSVDSDGNINLSNYENGLNYYIEKDGVEVDKELYDYVALDTKNNTIYAQLKINVENPTRYLVELDKEIYGEENIDLSGVKFNVESSLIKAQQAKYRQTEKEVGVTDVTSEGIVSGTTNEAGQIKFEETMVRAGTYEYWISEKEVANSEIINALGKTYIKVLVRVSSDGKVDTVTEDNQVIDGKFYLYDSSKENKIDFNTTSIDELVNVSITKEGNIYTLHISVENPQKYNLNIYKTDKDTDENMNGVEFRLKTYKENELGKLNEVELRKANDNTQVFDTKSLITDTVEAVEGVISLKDILIESAGTYYFELIEKTPKIPFIYKDKAENIMAKVAIDVQNVNGQNQYVVKEMSIVKGDKYTISENTKLKDSDVNVNVANERVKGSYNLDISKLEKLLGNPLKDAQFTIEAYQVNSEGKEEQISLFRKTDDVNSMIKIVPAKFTITNDNGIFSINNIRITRAETYIIQIKEIKAPNSYTILREPIRLRITTAIKGEYDDAEFVLESVELISGNNDGLVKVSNTENKITLDVTNDQFDLSLRKFISSINGKDITRWSEPQVDTSKLASGEETTAEYYNAKQPLRIYAGQEIIYTLRVYNEGQISGYVNKIVDHLPEQLEFLPEDEFNTTRGWKYVESDSSLRTIETTALSKETNEEENLIEAFDSKTGVIDYVEIQVKCKVKENVKAKTYITNIAEITEYEGLNRQDVVDRDSKGGNTAIPSGEELEQYKQNEINDKYVKGQEDDDDFEKVLVEEFDLALRKFITQVNDKEITSRIPVFKVDENGNYVYEHDKTPLIVAHDNLVEYTIRVFNEGTVSGYANLVKDDIPEGLEFIPENLINQEYRWIMVDSEGNETKDASKVKYVVTDYLSKENGEAKLAETESKENATNPNLIKYFDKDSMESPDYRDLKLVFRVNVPTRRDDVIINEAQISDDRDDNGDEVKDKDSTTDKWIDGEDDQDIELVKVKYFDLALYKWVTDAIVIENGKATEYPSKHTQSNKSNIVNVSIPKNKLNNITVKFRYTIKVENQGNLAGYAKEIKDHIPEGLKFVAEDNKQYGWVEQADGTITNRCFENTLLKEGDTAEVTVILTWINGAKNFGEKINYAEISEDENEYGSPDVDSTTNNFTDVPKEDDEDSDKVLLQIRTGISGQTVIYATIAVALMIVFAGVFGIKKYVINREIYNVDEEK